MTELTTAEEREVWWRSATWSPPVRKAMHRLIAHVEDAEKRASEAEAERDEYREEEADIKAQYATMHDEMVEAQTEAARLREALAEYHGVSEPDGYTICGFCLSGGHTEVHGPDCVVLKAREAE